MQTHATKTLFVIPYYLFLRICVINTCMTVLFENLLDGVTRGKLNLDSRKYAQVVMHVVVTEEAVCLCTKEVHFGCSTDA